MPKRLTRSVYAPFKEGPAEGLAVLFHGYGADADDLAPLAYTWGPHLTRTVFASFNAPHVCPTLSVGRQWFDLQDFDLARIWDDMARLVPLIQSSMNELLDEYELPAQKTVLVGFSQGAALALQQALYYMDVAGVLSYSGFLVPHPETRPPAAKPVLLVHGDRDTILPLQSLTAAQKTLKEANVPFESWVCEGLGHGISPFGLEKGRGFLQRILKDHPTKI